MIYQMADTAMNPRQTVRDIIGRPLEFYLGMRGDKKEARIIELLEMIELDASFLARLPGELSGGQKQRICIARALAAEPEFVICDEVTSALDQIVQEGILKLLLRLQDELGLTYLFISHNLAVVYYISDRLAVMYLGRLVEVGPARDIFKNPQHPYTRALLDSVLTPDPRLGLPNTQLGASYPNPIDPPTGCAFHPRCANAMPQCAQTAPSGMTNGDAYVECHLYSDPGVAKAG